MHELLQPKSGCLRITKVEIIRMATNQSHSFLDKILFAKPVSVVGVVRQHFFEYGKALDQGLACPIQVTRLPQNVSPFSGKNRNQELSLTARIGLCPFSCD